MEHDRTTDLAPRPIQRRLELIAGVGLLGLNRVALRAGLRSRVDGWRRAAGLVLRGPRSSFVLSAFGLDVWSDSPEASSRTTADTQAHLAERLHGFLQRESDLHICIRRGSCEHRAERRDGPSYSLACQAWAEGPSRFVPPSQWSGDGSFADDLDPGADVVFNFVCRVSAGGQADVWVRVNHVGADGVPVQEMLTRLEAEWGVAKDVAYPSPTESVHCCRPCAGTTEIQAFIDFAPLLAWRKSRNARLSEPMTLSAAMIWCLGRHPAFGDLRIGTTVEVDAVDGLGRGVGVVVVRPKDYFEREHGLAEYVRHFNHQMTLTRRRVSGSCKTLDAAALVPRSLARALLRHALENDPRAFGSMALTMLKDAKVFGAPLGEFGHPRGFLAVGSVALPARDGKKVGCVTIKGPETVIANYPASIQEAVGACAFGAL